MPNQVQTIAYDFGVEVVKVCKELAKSEHEYSLTDQFKRCATSIGANLAEANHAASRADFLNKMNIALKEADESSYWLNLLHDTEYISDEKFCALNEKITSILNLLSASVKTLKQSMNKNN